MKIALGGFMAVGKSRVGRLLAEHLQLRFIDLDREIEEQSGMPIPMLFDISEDFFRDKEEEALVSLINQENLVLSLGGGTLHFRENARLVQRSFQLFTLQASWDTLRDRILASDRPLAKEAKELFESRKEGYAQAGVQIDVEGKSPEQVMLDIVEQMQKEERC